MAAKTVPNVPHEGGPWQAMTTAARGAGTDRRALEFSRKSEYIRLQR